MENFIGIALSFLYIFCVIGLSSLLSKFTRFNGEFSRKFVHIMLGNWVFLTPFFTELWAVLFVPFVFIIINWLSKKRNVFKSIERQDESWGTVYYAISLFVLSFISFKFNLPIYSYLGILIMAYGDGLAALFGKKFSNKTSFLGVEGKSLIGSLTVFLVSIVVSISCLWLFYPDLSLINILVISFFTGLFASIIELIGKRGLDNLSLPLVSSFFIWLSLLSNTKSYYIYLLFICFVLFFAYVKNKISLDGLAAAFIVGAGIYSLGHELLAFALVTFFVLGSFITKLKNENKIKGEQGQGFSSARNWKQVLANSLPALLLSALYYFSGSKGYLLLAFSVFSAASSDTFASELSMLTSCKVYSILSFKEVRRGLSGGVSIAGLFFSFLGSLLLSLFACPIFSFKGFVLVALLGFLGSIIDSFLGATLQRKYLNHEGYLQDKKAFQGQKASKGFEFVSNNTVNLMTLCFVVLIGFILVF